MCKELKLSITILTAALLLGGLVGWNACLQLGRRAEEEVSLPLQAQPGAVAPYNVLGELVACSDAAQFALQLKYGELDRLLHREQIDALDVVDLVRELGELSDRARSSQNDIVRYLSDEDWASYFRERCKLAVRSADQVKSTP